MKNLNKKEDDEVISRIKNFGGGVVENIMKHENPNITIPQRGIGNVNFDAKSNLLTMGNKMSSRSFFNVAHSKKFVQTMLIASRCKDFVDKGKTASIRELYYQLKHTISGSKENTFDDQSESVCPDEPLLIKINNELKILPGSKVVEHAEKTGKKIFDKNGKVRIVDIDIKVYAFDYEQKITEHKVSMVMKHPSKEIRKIKTSSGREVKVTPNHSLFTLNKGEVKAVEAEKLTIGSYVALPRKIRIYANHKPINVVELLIKNAPDDVLNKIYLKSEKAVIDRILKKIGKEKLKAFSERYKNIWSDMTANWKHWETVPISLIKETSADITGFLDELKISCRGSQHKYATIIRKDKNLGTVLGFLISEGSHTSLDRKRNERHIAISNKSQRLLYEFIDAFNATFGDRTASSGPIMSGDGTYKLNLGYNVLAYILEYVFDYGPVHAWEKEVPPVILDAPDECIMGFLKSFREGDGSIDNKKLRIRYHTTSLELVNGIVFLLLRCGIFSNIYHYKKTNPIHHDAYEVRVGTGEYVKILSEITSDFKDMSLKRKSTMSGDRIPNIGKLINNTRRTCSKLKKKDYRKFDWSGIENKKKTICRVTLENILETLKPYDPDPRYFNILNGLAKGDIYWDRVTGITEAEVPPYTIDFEVNPTQNFIGGNGFLILHNSDPLIVDLETSLEVLREELHLKADDKGTLIGNIILEDSGDVIDCSKLGRSGLAIPSIIEHYNFE
ncbi:MAG: hypothetical protein CVT90_01620, partial [Candidatus Altiarchaeales archaeon HGW-Altiarchaeales-3]